MQGYARTQPCQPPRLRQRRLRLQDCPVVRSDKREQSKQCSKRFPREPHAGRCEPAPPRTGSAKTRVAAAIGQSSNFRVGSGPFFDFWRCLQSAITPRSRLWRRPPQEPIAVQRSERLLLRHRTAPTDQEFAMADQAIANLAKSVGVKGVEHAADAAPDALDVLRAAGVLYSMLRGFRGSADQWLRVRAAEAQWRPL